MPGLEKRTVKNSPKGIKYNKKSYLQKHNMFLLEKTISNEPDYIYHTLGSPRTKRLINKANYNIIINLVKEIKEMKNEIKDMKNKLENIAEKAETKEENRNESIYIYFETRSELMKTIDYCKKESIPRRPEAPGTLRIFSYTDLNKLSSADLKFKIVKDIQEIYSNKKFIESHKKQIEEFYGV